MYIDDQEHFAQIVSSSLAGTPMMKGHWEDQGLDWTSWPRNNVFMWIEDKHTNNQEN